MLRRIERFPKPVIAAMNGHALGGGCEIAMACHFRLLKETARMGQTESNLGHHPRLRRHPAHAAAHRPHQALEFLILGTQIPAPECLPLGLANRLAKEGETLNDAKALARELAKRPPIATRLIIEAVDEGLEAPIDKAIDIEIRAFLTSAQDRGRLRGHPGLLRQARAEFKGK